MDELIVYFLFIHNLIQIISHNVGSKE